MILQIVIGLFFLTSAYPLWAAWQANRKTTLRPSVGWAALAWAVWGWSLYADTAWPEAAADKVRYLALSLTGCAGVAVLGARRPGVGAWHFVLLGLLAVMLLPLAEAGLAGKEFHLDRIRAIFLGATLAMAVLNYLPTRMAPAALLLGAGCTIE